MKFRSLMTAICVLATASIVSAQPFAYVANSGTNQLSKIDTAITPIGNGSNTIVSTSPLPKETGTSPYAYSVAVSPSGQYVYVGLQTTNEIVVIDSAKAVSSSAAYIARIGLGTDGPGGLAVNAAETRLYVTSSMSDTLIVIDISSIKSGSGVIAEVGRVTVDDHSVSNPNGIVLQKVSDTLSYAYIANTSQGSISKISLNEATDTYTRLSITDLGGVSPVGLTLSSDGTILYASSLSGDIRAVRVSDMSVLTPTPQLKTANGNVTLAAYGTTVYAPSNSVDKLYTITGTDASTLAVGSNYSTDPGPYSVAITPDGTKLFITMNTTTGGETVQVLNTADLNHTPVTTIALPPLLDAKAIPTSFGNFIGPLLPYTITASKDASGICTIVPEGAIPVNSLGRRFAISGSGCKVLIDGVAESGTPNSYTFSSPVAADHTIYAADPTLSYTLSGDWSSSVGGYLVSTPSGITGTPVAVKSASFLNGLKVTLQAQNGFKVQSGWGGDCTGAAIVGDTCVLTMTGNKTWGTPTIIVGGGKFYKGSTWYQDWASCNAAIANGDHVKVSTDVTSLTTSGTSGWMIYLSNQWMKTDPNTKGTYTPMTLTITNIGVTVEPTNSLVL